MEIKKKKKKVQTRQQINSFKLKKKKITKIDSEET